MRRNRVAVIIDTDIGTDVDDMLAIAYAIKSGMDIKLITTVHGDTEKRAKIAKKWTMLLGADIEVAIGESKPIKQVHIFDSGKEGEGFIDKNERFDVKKDGIDALAECIYQNKGIEIVSIGPLTNIAKAFQKYPDLALSIGHIYIMGNAIITHDNFYLNYGAHNFKVDPEAVDIVFAADVAKTIVTTDVCKKNYITREEFRELEGNPVLNKIRQEAFKWLDHIGYNEAFLYDPLVLHHIIDDRITDKVSYGNVRVTTDVRDGFKEKFMSRLLV